MFNPRGVDFISLNENLDTSTPMGEVIYLFAAALASCEVNANRERTMAGLAAARLRGRYGGRPRALNNEQTTLIEHLHAEGSTVSTIARTVGTSRATVYRHLDRVRTSDDID